MVWCNKSDCITNTIMTIETRYRCTACYYERTLVYGTQWSHVDELHRYRRDILRGKYGDQAKKWLMRYPEEELIISTALFSCRRCKTIQTTERILFEYPGVPSREIPVHCTVCHAPCKLLKSPPPSLLCPACRKTCLSDQLVLQPDRLPEPLSLAVLKYCTFHKNPHYLTQYICQYKNICIPFTHQSCTST